ncbi:MAG: TonB-dependent receptor [FCB group bacterium]|jgi:iron complex outermembrane receptor protein
MKKLIITLILFLIPVLAAAQSSITGNVKDESGATLRYVHIYLTPLPSGITIMTQSDKKGNFSFSKLSEGKYLLSIKQIGFKNYFDTIPLPQNFKQELDIYLSEEPVEQKEVVVSATRTARTLEDIPMRVELIPAEDMDEEINNGLSSAKMALGELPGIMAQGVSSALGASVMRIRGLDGRYVQLLVDGVPAFSGLNMNFSVLQLAPLNLKQLEIIKGSAAGLQSDAIGGIINYITRVPSGEKPEAVVAMNFTSLKGMDFAGWYGQYFGDLGFSLHTTYNYQPRFDIDKDGFADEALQKRININPKLFYNFNNKLKITFSGNYLNEHRLGGMMAAPEDFDNGSAGIFSAALNTERFDGIATLDYYFNDENSFAFNGAYINTTRNSYRQLVQFNGTENIKYADLHWNLNLSPFSLLSGVELNNRVFEEASADSIWGKRNYSYLTLSLYMQGEYQFSQKLSALALLRLDNQNKSGTVLVPRFSLLYKPAKDLALRGSVGTGWRLPTIFDENAEERAFYGVPPITSNLLEKSLSYSVNCNYKTSMKESLILTFDLSLYSSTIKNKTELEILPPSSGIPCVWTNDGKLTSNGFELIIEGDMKKLNFFIGYNFNDVNEEQNGVSSEKIFTPKHNLTTGLAWTIFEKCILRGEMMFTSSQLLPANPYEQYSPAFITFGASIEYPLSNNITIFANAEDAGDSRQTRSMPLYLGTPGASNFNTNFIWGPVDGRVLNAGIKYKL